MGVCPQHAIETACVPANWSDDRTPVSPIRLNPDIPAELERIINRALEKDRNLRYQHASEMRAELQRLKRDTESSRSAVVGAVELVAPSAAQTPSGRIAPTAMGEAIAPQIPISGTVAAPGSGRRRWIAGLAIALTLVLVGAVAFVSHSRSQREISSIAVLPFVNASNDPNNEYLSDGLTESLINSLSQVPGLAVMSRSSVFLYKGRDVDPQLVAHELKVEGVVTGRIVERGDQLIVSAELIDARTNHNLWGDHYDRKLSDLLAVQQDITGAISAKLRERLSGEIVKQLAKGGTNNPEAYQLYLKGRYYWEKRTPETLQKAKDYFNQAIERDPNYALAYVGLADYYNVLPDYAPASVSETAPKALAAAQKALAIDDTLAEAHATLASANHSSWNWSAADREFRRALELNPNYANAHKLYSLYLLSLGHYEEALAEIKRAVELDPLNLKYSDNLGRTYQGGRRYDLAIEQFKKTFDMDPNFASAHGDLAYTYFEMGKYDLWLHEWKKAAVLFNDQEEMAIADDVASVYAKSGLQAAISKDVVLRKQLAARRYVDPDFIAYDYAALGNKDQAFYWLEKAYVEKAGGLLYVKTESRVMEVLRSDPRYADLLKRMGLPQ